MRPQCPDRSSMPLEPSNKSLHLRILNDSYNYQRSLTILKNYLPSSPNMSIHRCLSPLTSSSFAVFRFAANMDVTLRALPYTLRNFNSGPQNQLSSKRKLQTATAYRPNSLDSIPQPPPPRNVVIPENSIVGGVPQVFETRPPQLIDLGANSPPRPRQTEIPPFSVLEAEVRNITPVSEAAKSRPKESRLRARKAAMILTPSATAQLRNLLSSPEPKMIRVGVKNRGCSGLAYHLEYVEKPGKFDETVEQDGVKVLIDSKALFSIIGSEMDWVEDKLNARFVFRNPNISQLLITSQLFGSTQANHTLLLEEQCGCGESFMV